MMVRELARDVGVQRACAAQGVARSSFYDSIGPSTPAPAPVDRNAAPTPVTTPKPRPSPRRLSTEEEDLLLTILLDERFADASVDQIYYTLLDQGVYLGKFQHHASATAA